MSKLRLNGSTSGYAEITAPDVAANNTITLPSQSGSIIVQGNSAVPVVIGSATSTGTASQRLQVTGGAYVSGNVGIGKTAPTTALEINQAGTEQLRIYGEGAGYFLAGYDQSSNRARIGGYNGSSWTTLALNEGGSNVGIGITNPIGQLQVSSGPVIIGAATSTGTASQPLQVTGGAYVSGSVGIGITNPGCSLQINGGVRARGGAPGITGVNNNGYAFSGGSGDNDSGMFSSADGQLEFYVNNSEALRITSGRALYVSQTPGNYTIDTTGGGAVVANNGTVDFPNASGMLIVNNHNSGAITIYLCGGGVTVVVSNVTTQVGTFSHNSGIGGYRWTNNSGSTATFGFFFVRTRTFA